ncbi:MAG: LytTR family transcriptional regulator [Aquisalinus sp.]|nr:LytTR family transcriptional regulator [Aquisalinus sp.]
MRQHSHDISELSDLEKAQRREWTAGLAAILTLAVFLFVSMLVDVLSHISEAERLGHTPIWGQVLVAELSSRVALVILFFALLSLMIRMPLNLDNWQRRLPLYLGMMLIFSLAHVCLMVVLRKSGWPLFIGAPYEFAPAGSTVTGEFVYEFRKDIVTFWTAFALMRLFQHNADLRQELSAARQEAQQFSRLTLKCGGRSIFLDAHQIEWAKAAGNYVELSAGGKLHLARMTLKALEDQLEAAGAGTVRVHRSWLVSRNAIGEIRPGPSGDQQIKLSSGLHVPVSRRYKGRLELND